MAMNRGFKIFGLSLDNLTADQVLVRIKETAKPLWIVTANPEILLAAKHDKTYADVLRQADLRLVDGFGIQLMMGLCASRVHRVPGVDLAEKIVALASQQGWRVGLFGGGVLKSAQPAADVLRQKHPNIQIMAENGGQVDSQGNDDATDDATGEEARHRMVMFAPEVLLVALGHPKQDFWIVNHAADFPGLKVIIGLGGTFDYWAGAIKRAPFWMRRIGLEWLWRLFVEPKRLKRILNAVFIFPWQFLVDRIAPAS